MHPFVQGALGIGKVPRGTCVNITFTGMSPNCFFENCHKHRGLHAHNVLQCPCLNTWPMCCQPALTKPTENCLCRRPQHCHVATNGSHLSEMRFLQTWLQATKELLIYKFLDRPSGILSTERQDLAHKFVLYRVEQTHVVSKAREQWRCGNPCTITLLALCKWATLKH